MSQVATPKPQTSSKPEPRPIGEGLFDQFREISADVKNSLKNDLVRPGLREGIDELFPWAQPGISQQPREEILFDGEEERKKQAILSREQKNRQTIAELQQKLRAEQQGYQRQVEELTVTIEQVAKSAGIDTPPGVTKVPQKPGTYHVSFFLRILSDYRKKADEAQEWQRTQALRVRTKPSRGVELWTGDQKKIQEAGGTFLLQG